MRAVGPVTRRAAPVPAEVMKLVARGRHWRLVDDPAIVGVDHGEKVWGVDPGSCVKAGEVEKLLG